MESADYRLYLQSQFEQIHEKLDEIKVQVVKTNGRVSELEKCNPGKRLDKLEEELRDVGFFARHPRMFVGLIVVLVVLALVGGLGNVISKFI
jgi:hypothetical protein